MASPMFLQYVRGRMASVIQRLCAASQECGSAITSGGDVGTDAAIYAGIDVSATASFTLSNPTGGTNFQKFVWRITNNSGSSITVTLGDEFTFGANVTSFPAIAAGDTALLAAIYRGGVPFWDVVATDVF